jgi:hypothetical protein
VAPIGVHHVHKSIKRYEIDSALRGSSALHARVLSVLIEHRHKLSAMLSRQDAHDPPWAATGPGNRTRYLKTYRGVRLNKWFSTIKRMHHDERLVFLTDDELETVAPDYIWASEMGDEAERSKFTDRLDQLVAEAKRRGKPEIIDRARARLVQPENPCDRAGAREDNWSRNLKLSPFPGRDQR